MCVVQFGYPCVMFMYKSYLNHGLAIRNMGVVALTAFACSLVASLKHMATVFPEWITLGQQGELLQISHDASPVS